MAEDKVNEPSRGRVPPKKTTRVKKSPVTRPAGSNRQAIVSWFALFLSVAAAGTGGYAWYQGVVDSKSNAGQQETRLNLIEQRIGQRIDGIEQTQTGRFADLSTGVDELGDSLVRTDADVREQIQDIRNEITNQENSIREQIQDEIDTLSDRLAELRSQLDSNLDEWVLEEVEQLVLIAWQRLQFAGETGLAKQALQLADQRLKQLSGSSVNEVRRLLSSDIAALDRIPPVDVPGLLNELSVLSVQVDALPLAGDIVLDANTGSDAGREKEDESQRAESQENADQTAGLDRYLKPVMDAGAALLTNLGDLVQVEKNGNPVKPVISAEIREMTYARARLILESAQVALVRANPGLYSHRIHAASEWVEQNFDRDDVLTQDWIQRLNRVGSSYQAPGIPDISETLSAVRALGGSVPAL